jgi:hypothetical protein
MESIQELAMKSEQASITFKRGNLAILSTGKNGTNDLYTYLLRQN